MLKAMVLCLIAVVVTLPAASAALTPVPVEGTIMVSASSETLGIYTYFLEGTSDNVVAAPAAFSNGEISPYMDRVAYSDRATWPETATSIWTANVDGSDAVNLTALAGLGGANCAAAWSPDARQIAFHHADSTTGVKPCDAGWQAWVMNGDGTGAHQVMAEGSPASWAPSWSPDGSRLIFNVSDVGVVSARADGSDQVVLPNVANWPDWSPDGASIASTVGIPGTSGSESGYWFGLRITNADGSGPRDVFQRFVSDADIATHIDLYGSIIPSNVDPTFAIVSGLGPSGARWSPRGNRIVFIMAYPFDPDGPYYQLQVEVWLYDLDTDEVTQITSNSEGEFDVSWDGDNTLPEDPEVTVDNVTVDVGEVAEPGTTTIVLESDPPALPDSYLSASDSYVLNTTALATGPAEVSMTYDATTVPGTAGNHLKLLRYDEGAAEWQDITASRDLINHVIKGSTTALGLMQLSWPLPESDFTDVSDAADDPFWALWEIQAAADAGIVQGYWDGYHPERPVDRASMAVYISRALADGDANVPATPAAVSFPDDVPNTHWAYKYVEYAVAAGVVQGYADGGYHPDTILTRDQMTVFVARAKQWVHLGDDMSAAPELFTDVPAGFWCGTAVQACVEHRVVRGYADGSYHPERQVTRDQMAVYVARAFGLAM